MAYRDIVLNSTEVRYDSIESAQKFIKIILVFIVSRNLSPGIYRTEVFCSANRTEDDGAPAELHAEK